MVIDRAELGAWLRLTETPKLGREAARRLLAAFGSPEAVFAAGPDAWAQAAGSRAIVGLLESPPPTLPAQIGATLRWLDALPETRHVIVLGDPQFPPALLESPDPPLLLFAQGRIELLRSESIAIVGSRRPTPQGIANAEEFAAALVGAGLAIVSGLALGIDAAAHRGALRDGGATIAVIGTGIDQCYPRSNRGLADRISAEGLILSEYPLGMPPLAQNFPQRNRIIAGLTRGTLVVEAALQSGSLISARLANEAGRDVFAIPGSIHAPQAKGCHALIKQGAKLVETAQDVLDDLGVLPTPLESSRSSPARAPKADVTSPAPADESARAASSASGILDAMGHDPVALDSLAARTGLPASELSILLLELELDGRISRLPGQLFQRLTRTGGAGV